MVLDVNATTYDDNDTPLFEAIFANNDIDVRELLKSPQIDLTIKTKFLDKILTLSDAAKRMMGYMGRDPAILHMIEQVLQVQAEIRQQAWQQARQQIYGEAIALATAQLPRAGVGSPAKVLSPADIEQICKLLEPALYRKIYRELITPYLEPMSTPTSKQ